VFVWEVLCSGYKSGVDCVDFTVLSAALLNTYMRGLLSCLTTLQSIDCGSHVHGVLPFLYMYPQRIRFLFGALGVHDDAELAKSKRNTVGPREMVPSWPDG
jgi:hypothetical protein